VSLEHALQERMRESRAGLRPGGVRLTAALGEQRNAIREYWARIKRKRATCGYFFVVGARRSGDRREARHHAHADRRRPRRQAFRTRVVGTARKRP
jgi:hypothetical protein